MKKELNRMYTRLYKHFGPQHWWPAKSSFEVMVGAILTQNTSWTNVEKAIKNLKKNKLLNPLGLRRITDAALARLIKPAGYYNIKTVRLKNYARYLMKHYKGNIRKMLARDVDTLRRELLAVNGIGPETADSILLYALHKPVFVIDAYTKRILSRHGFLNDGAGYDEAQRMFMTQLDGDARLFNEFHALLVRLAKVYCLKRRPLCEGCPLG